MSEKSPDHIVVAGRRNPAPFPAFYPRNPNEERDMSETGELKKHLWKKMTEGPFVMMGLADRGGHSEPLTVQLDKDQVDTLFFFIRKDNRLASGGAAMVQFVSKGQDFFACLSGNASVSNDRAIIDKLWSKPAESWFPGGKTDPNLALLRFDIDDAEMWESDVSVAGKLKMLFGGKIDPEEAGHHARVGTTAV
jgi:general stress protein 26